MTGFHPDPAAWGLALLALSALALLTALAPRPLVARAIGSPLAWREGIAPALVGLATGVATLAATAAVTAWPTALALAFVSVVLAAVLVVDLQVLLIPDLHVVLLLAAALVGPLASPPIWWISGAALGGGLLWAVRTAYRRARGVDGLGLGDVKLMAALGALAGPERVLWIIIGGAVLGVVWGLTRPAPGGREAPIPFGAAAALPALVVLAIGRAGA